MLTRDKLLIHLAGICREFDTTEELKNYNLSPIVFALVKCDEKTLLEELEHRAKILYDDACGCCDPALAKIYWDAHLKLYQFRWDVLQALK